MTLLLLCSGTFLFIGLKGKNLINPLVVFNGTWFVCFVLYTLELSEAYSNLISDKARNVLLTMLVAFNVFYYFGLYIRTKERRSFLAIIKATKKEKYLKILFFIWLSLIVFEMIYFKGVPLVWRILGRTDVSYVSFGIPSVHGFINSLAWLISSLSFMDYLQTRRRENLFYLICINGVFLVLLARQAIVTEVVQLMTILLCVKKISIKRIVAIIIGFIIAFGLIGNYRTPPEVIINSSGFKYTVPIFLLGIVWVYMYMVSPLANMINLINHWTNYQYGIITLNNALPSVIAKGIELKPRGVVESFLVSETYNMSTGLSGIYEDFGVLGIALFFAIIGYFGGRLWCKATINKRSNKNLAIINYSVYSGAICLLFFFNAFTTLPILMQFVYSNFLFKNYFFINKDDAESGEVDLLKGRGGNE